MTIKYCYLGMSVLKRQQHQTKEKSKQKVWNTFKKAAAGLSLSIALATGIGCKESPQPLPEPIISIQTEYESVPVGDPVIFNITAQNVRADERAKAAIFVLSPDNDLFFGREAELIPGENNIAFNSYAIVDGDLGLYVLATKLMEPRESNWAFRKVGIRPDIPSPPENLLSFEIANWHEINAELNTLSQEEIELPFSFGTIPLVLESPRAIADTDQIFHYAGRGRDNPDIRAGITVNGSTSRGFIIYPMGEATPFNGNRLQWLTHNETGDTIIYRNGDEVVGTFNSHLAESENPNSKCLPNDGIYRASVYYDSRLDVSEIVGIIEQAKIYLEPLEREIFLDGPWERESLLHIDATELPAHQEFLRRRDMPFPGCDDSDLKIYFGNMNGAASSGFNTIIMGVGQRANTQQSSSEVLTHEIGHFFGAQHDCSNLENADEICLGIEEGPKRLLHAKIVGY